MPAPNTELGFCSIIKLTPGAFHRLIPLSGLFTDMASRSYLEVLEMAVECAEIVLKGKIS